jgi:2,4-dienoyl-CoA reductase-like NADH-dependent reductase (Old Yellow Enzyme family)
MNERSFLRLGSVRDVETFRRCLQQLQLDIPCDEAIIYGSESPLAQPICVNGITVGNRIAIHPMEGWDGTADGKPTENTVRRWRRFGQSGAKLIWGGEAVAVRHDGRANPNQLLINSNTIDELARLRAVLIEEHQNTTGSRDGLLVGLQLTHSGRYSRPNAKDRPEPRILYHHPILDPRLGLSADYPVLTDGEVRKIIDAFHEAARLAWQAGFDFVDIKHCHGYLGHEFLSAHTRGGDYGGSFENRTRFLREVVEGVRAAVPGLQIGVRLSAFDTVPFRPDPERSSAGKLGPGVPELFESLLPYRWGFGVNVHHPVESDLTEAVRFLSLLRALDIRLVNLSAGSPYYNPHIQRPALYPPSDGYQPPEDPLVGVARQMHMVRELKRQFSDLLIVGTAYSYLQDFLPYVAQGALRQNWVDSVGLGRMVLAYPELLWDVLEGRPINHKQVCRTFSDCTTAPRNGLPSGCYPLDSYYKQSDDGARLKQMKVSSFEFRVSSSRPQLETQIAPEAQSSAAHCDAPEERYSKPETREDHDN